MEITINQNDNQLITIGNSNIQDINITEDENQEIEINNITPQSLNVNQPETQTILIDGGGAVIGITDVLVNGVTVVSGNIAYVTVPTKTSELINNSGFITNETDPTVPLYIKQITLADINNWNSKQNQLVSGNTIKTINNESLLGSGNINITGTIYQAGDGINIENDIISNEITSYNDLEDLPTIPTLTSQLLNDSDFVSENELSEVAFTGSYASLSNTPEIPDATSDLTNDGNGTYPFLLNKSSQYIDGIGTLGGGTAQGRNLAYTWDNGIVQESHTIANYDDLTNELATKQDTLVSGTNIKTINNTSLLGSGNINISGGSYSAGDGIDITSNVISTNLINSVSGSGSTIIQANNGNIILRPKGSSDSSVQAYLNTNGNFYINGNKVYSTNSLFSGDTAGTVSLTDNVSNYDYIEIYFRTNDGSNYKSSVKVISPNNAIADLVYHYYTGVCYIKCANVNISGNAITFVKNFQMYNGGNYSEGAYISITNVIGYK